MNIIKIFVNCYCKKLNDFPKNIWTKKNKFPHLMKKNKKNKPDCKSFQKTWQHVERPQPSNYHNMQRSLKVSFCVINGKNGCQNLSRACKKVIKVNLSNDAKIKALIINLSKAFNSLNHTLKDLTAIEQSFSVTTFQRYQLYKTNSFFNQWKKFLPDATA